MQTIDGGLIAALQEGEGIECLTTFSIGGHAWFCDRAFGNIYSGIKGKILECSDIETVQRLDKGGSGSGQVSITLDNSDEYFDHVNLMDYIYQQCYFAQNFYRTTTTGVFQELGSVIVFKGWISTPLKWDEKSRSITFTAVQGGISQDAGKCLEDLGWFDKKDAVRLLGQPLPMIFGKVYHAPAVQITANPSIWTLDGFGIVDKTLPLQIAYLTKQIQAADAALQISIASALAQCWNQESSGSLDALMQGGFAFTGVSTMDCYNQAEDSIVGMIESFAKEYQEMKHEQEALLIEQTNQTTLAGTGPCHLQLSQAISSPLDGCQMRVDNILFNGNIPTDSLNGTMSRLPIPGPGEFYQQFIAMGFKYVRAGSRVQIVSPLKIWYIVSITPGTVNKVYAHRSVAGSKQLCAVPTDWYTLDTIGTTKCVVLNRPLAARDWIQEQRRTHFEDMWGQYLPIHLNQPIDWDDEIYVEFTSTIGPNPLAIINWLITTFNPALGTVTFDGPEKAWALLSNLKMNFRIVEKTDCLKLCEEIAYQCDCVLYLRNDQLFLRYLPVPSDPSATITVDDIIYGSLSLESSNVDEIITRYIETCRLDYSPYFEKPVTTRLTRNTAKYGLRTESHDFFCYTTPYFAENAATYWFALYNDPHLVVQFKTLPYLIGIQTLDYVTTPYGNGMVRSVKYNSKDSTCDFIVDIWNLALGNLQVDQYWPDYVSIEPGGGAEPAGGKLKAIAEQSFMKYEVTWPDALKTSDKQPLYGPPVANDAYAPLPALGFTPDVPPLGTGYQYKQHGPFNPVPLPKFAIAPGQVKRKTKDSMYTVIAYPKGISAGGVAIQAKQLQIDSSDTIPDGSWCIVVGIQEKDDNGQSAMHYYMQLPVWLG